MVLWFILAAATASLTEAPLPGPACSVDDDEFWEGITPVTLGGMPKLREKVTVVG